MRQAQEGHGDVSPCCDTRFNIGCCEGRSINPRRNVMKGIILTAALLLASSTAYADSCKVEAGSKKLAGAAMNSFMKKCATDATAACDKAAPDTTLAVAAKTSFTKRAVSEAVAS